ncbi:polysaccharide deacetylase family protein [Corallococcus sp. BB11-1]|uniref:polysaccharide deacetylase family protein n=1 Tax=Corallococcus sp. BB11-1 TaxID=2996783 RepID=UPI0010E1FC61|nr:polysaccharide deacetylase family protein [Corallococcus sp. BB11-1]MCY1033841.1 polysaccharide deacetylase family protein [Corallococcus sp. BB11-1]RYZ46922.1 MAG: polysaccharide deacetylase [Myxococcaceae bacterium]
MSFRTPLSRVLCAAVFLCASSAFAASPFTEGMVSIALDDGWTTQYTLARPALNSRGLRATYYVVTDAVDQGWSGYMSLAQVRTLHAENHEIASHTRTHADLTSLTPAQLTTELHDSRAWLAANVGAMCGSNFASPYGAYNATVMTSLKAEYASHRTINAGRNYRDTVVYELRANDVSSAVSVATVKGWINQAIAEKSWLIILFHEFTTGTPTRTTQYRSTNFASILNHVTSTGIRTVTVAEGLALTDGLTDAPPSVGTVIYDDAMGSGFQDWSWATHDLDEAVTVHAGSTAIRFEPDYWEALMFHHTGLDLALYQSIDLWVHGGTTGGQQLRLALYDNATHLGSINLASVLGHPLAAGTWQKVSIPLSLLGATSGTVNDFYLSDDSGSDQSAVYVDDFVLVPH